MKWSILIKYVSFVQWDTKYGIISQSSVFLLIHTQTSWSIMKFDFFCYHSHNDSFKLKEIGNKIESIIELIKLKVNRNEWFDDQSTNQSPVWITFYNLNLQCRRNKIQTPKITCKWYGGLSGDYDDDDDDDDKSDGRIRSRKNTMHMNWWIWCARVCVCLCVLNNHKFCTVRGR